MGEVVRYSRPSSFTTQHSIDTHNSEATPKKIAIMNERAHKHRPHEISVEPHIHEITRASHAKIEQDHVKVDDVIRGHRLNERSSDKTVADSLHRRDC
jgi:hypothetical protein